MILFSRTDYTPKFLRISDVVGMIPEFLDDTDQATAAQQFDKKYSYGGGWTPMRGRWEFDTKDNSIKYPGDPKHKPWAEGRFRDERIYVYESAWVCIVQPDGSFEVSRMD